jgi:hypothetical protein
VQADLDHCSPVYTSHIAAMTGAHPHPDIGWDEVLLMFLPGMTSNLEIFLISTFDQLGL